MKRPNTLSALILAVVIVSGLVAAASIYWTRERQSAGPPEKLTLALTANYIGSSLVYIAAENGYFKDAGLEITLQGHTSGQAALTSMLDGKADLATTTDTGIMFAVMRGLAVSIIATICASAQEHGIVARKDRGIATPADLVGKRVATQLGTATHYVLDTILVGHNIQMKQLRVTNLKPDQMVDALRNDEVDAVATWEPYLSHARNVLAGNDIVFFAERGYLSFFNVAGRPQFVKQHQGAVQKFLRALARAEQFIDKQPADARTIIARAASMDPGALERLWPKYKLRMTLDQGLLTQLDARAQWAIRNQYVPRSELPNFLKFIDTTAIAAVNPDALTIIR